MVFTIDSAKQFLLSKISERAQLDGVPLDEIEKRMFLFSEASSTPDFEANEAFESNYNTNAYEAKITKLLRKAYARDKKSEEGRCEWREALDALTREDFYGLVMVDQARIPRKSLALWSFAIEMLPFAFSEFAILILGWFLVFQPARLKLYLPDWFRLLLMLVFLWASWCVGKIFTRIRTAKRVHTPE
jgi:hypothetical protein